MADEQPALLPDPFTVGRWWVEPRGSRMACDARDDVSAPFVLFRVAADTGRASPITSPLPESIGDLAATPSPDERFLFFTRVDRQDADILLLERSDTGTR